MFSAEQVDDLTERAASLLDELQEVLAEMRHRFETLVARGSA